MIADFTNMPFPSDSFALVVFDPPHLAKLGATGKYATSYGRLEGNWRDDMRKGFSECFRVLRSEGVLVFKWCEYEIPLREVLALTPEKPLFGHISGKRQQTHWVCFLKA
jgi:SAM-dependent methyltransferase